MQRPENTNILLDIVDDPGFYTKLFAIQILACILECRAQQLQECVMNSPTGTSALVGILDEKREQLRNEGLLLLIKLVRHHTEIQKRVAFENAFEKVLAIVDEEGGLEGGIITVDCFTLLHHLLAGNQSNQNWFRETEFFKRITELLQGVRQEKVFSQSLTGNTVAALKIVRLFIPKNSSSRTTNQNSFLKSGLVTQAIGLSFSEFAPAGIRTEALLTVSELIYQNQLVQDYFVKASKLIADSTGTTPAESQDVAALYAIMLDGADDDFSLRYAAALCAQAFASGNQDHKLQIVRNINDDYLVTRNGTLLESILSPPDYDNQHRIWFACSALIHLTHGDDEACSILTELFIGDASAGEEEVSSIQTISACLVACLQAGRTRAAIAYSMLLSSWFFEKKDNVADFLEESSALQALLSAVRDTKSGPELKGVLACLLSLCYAFDFSESTSVSRADLQSAILRVGRDSIVGSITTLSLLEEVQQEPQTFTAQTDFPLLDVLFVEFFKDNFGLIRKALDQPPIPLRTRREEEAQEEQDRTEDIIADLESELERKSSGLEEAVNIIKTRQEELQRLREEIRYNSEKHQAALSQCQQELEKARQEVNHLKDEVTTSSNDIDKGLREVSRLQAELDAARKGISSSMKEQALMTSKLEHFELELQSEASKRSFLEKELNELRQTSGTASQNHETVRAQLCAAQGELAQVIDELASTRADNKAIREDLLMVRAAQKKAEQESSANRTKARDLDSELKGVRQELDECKSTSEKERITLDSQREKAERDLQVSTEEKGRLQLDLETIELEHSKKAQQAAERHAKELTNLIQLRTEAEATQKHAQSRITNLETQLAKSKDVAKRALDTTQEESSAAKSGVESTRTKELEQRVMKLEQEKEDLQKQLEQTQEDLMLLMDDEVRSETGTST